MGSMRVAMIAPPWLPIPPVGYGGIENVLHALIPQLLELGVEVELFTVGDSTVPATKKHYLYPSGQYEHIHKPQYDTVPISSAHLHFALNIIEQDRKFDLIHDHNIFTGPMILAHACDRRPPIIHTYHGPAFTTQDRLDAGIPDNLTMWRQFSYAKKFHVVPISEAVAQAAPKELRSHLLPVVYNAVSVEDFPFVANKENYFVTLARVSADKGQALAVEACLELKQRLKMCGSVATINEPQRLLMELANPLSEYRNMADFKYYSDQILPHVIEDGLIENLGDVSGQHRLDVISKAKGLLFPIQWEEPFGMAAIEVLACGTPVVSLARGALPEIIEHGVNGFLAHNMKEFKHYMTLVGEIDPQACRDSVARKFSAKLMAKQYLDRYKSVLSQHKRG